MTLAGGLAYYGARCDKTLCQPSGVNRVKNFAFANIVKSFEDKYVAEICYEIPLNMLCLFDERDWISVVKCYERYS